MKKTIKGKLTLNTAIFIVAAIIVCEIVSVNALKTNMTNQTRQYVSSCLLYTSPSPRDTR